MHYEAAVPRTREDLEIMLRSQEPGVAESALVSAAFFEPDWPWVESVCLSFGRSSNPSLRRISAVCLGHLARLHGRFSSNASKQLLQKLLDDVETKGAAETALEDVEHYIKP